jgi:hypothetical protein
MKKVWIITTSVTYEGRTSGCFVAGTAAAADDIVRRIDTTRALHDAWSDQVVAGQNPEMPSCWITIGDTRLYVGDETHVNVHEVLG